MVLKDAELGNSKETMAIGGKGKRLTFLLKKGEESAFEEIYLSSYAAVRYFINQYVQDLAISEDLAQETFYYLWKNREKIDPAKDLRSYVMAIARSKSLNYLRGERYDREYITLMIDQANSTGFANMDDPIFNDMLHKDLLGRINLEIDRLPEKQREVMILSRKKYLTNKEIAQKLQINIKTVEYRLMVALKQIRKKINIF